MISLAASILCALVAAVQPVRAAYDPNDPANPVTMRDRAIHEQLVCPAGGVLAGARPPQGRQVWCESNGVKNGPTVSWASPSPPNDFVSFTGNHRDGELDGTYVMWGRNGEVWDSGEYSAGRLIRSTRSPMPKRKKMSEGWPGLLAFAIGFIVIVVHPYRLRKKRLIDPQGNLIFSVWPIYLGFLVMGFCIFVYEEAPGGEGVLAGGIAVFLALGVVEFFRVRRLRQEGRYFPEPPPRVQPVPGKSLAGAVLLLGYGIHKFTGWGTTAPVLLVGVTVGLSAILYLWGERQRKARLKQLQKAE